jgi:hypothetical protein
MTMCSTYEFDSAHWQYGFRRETGCLRLQQLVSRRTEIGEQASRSSQPQNASEGKPYHDADDHPRREHCHSLPLVSLENGISG